MELVRGRLSKMQRAVLSALIVIEVHAKDVAAKLVEEGISSVNDFEWISQLRFNLLLSPLLDTVYGPCSSYNGFYWFMERQNCEQLYIDNMQKCICL